jgi:hypothetical protein
VSDVLGRLVDRALGAGEAIRPRVAARFEPAAAATGPRVEGAIPPAGPSDVADQGLIRQPRRPPFPAAPEPGREAASPVVDVARKPERATSIPGPSTARPRTADAPVRAAARPVLHVTEAAGDGSGPRPPATDATVPAWSSAAAAPRSDPPPAGEPPAIAAAVGSRRHAAEVRATRGGRHRVAAAPDEPAAVPAVRPHKAEAPAALSRIAAGSQAESREPRDARTPVALRPVDLVAAQVVVRTQLASQASADADGPRDLTPGPGAARPIVRVSIGRIEVRAVPARRPAERRAPERPSAAPSLEEYLRARNGTGR